MKEIRGKSLTVVNRMNGMHTFCRSSYALSMVTIPFDAKKDDTHLDGSASLWPS